VLKHVDDSYVGLVIGRLSPRIWSLPKGHVEPNEAAEDAATREVLEETGIAATIIEKLADIRYWFYRNKNKHDKTVHFYLMRFLSGEPTPQAGEVDETKWVPLDKLPVVLTHLNERRLVQLAQTFVHERSAAELGFKQ